MDFDHETGFKSFIICFNFIICWIGMVCFFVIEVIKEEEPNNPVNKGNKGSLRFKFKEKYPKNPERIIINNVNNFLFFPFSKKIIIRMIIIKIIGIIL